MNAHCLALGTGLHRVVGNFRCEEGRIYISTIKASIFLACEAQLFYMTFLRSLVLLLRLIMLKILTHNLNLVSDLIVLPFKYLLHLDEFLVMLDSSE